MLYYITQVHILLIISYLIFHFLIKKNHNYKLNRFYLLLSILLSVIAPLLLKEQLPAAKLLGARLLPELQAAISLAKQPNYNFDWLISSFTLLYAYETITFILLALSAVRIIRLFSHCKQLRSNAFIVEENIYYVKKAIRPFSFMRHIYLPHTLLSDEHSLGMVKKHELSHVKQLHSWDLMLIEVTNSLFFLNIFQVKLRKSIQENHEYLADQDALKEVSIPQYIKVMLESTVHSLYPKYVNHFSKPLIFKRLAMLKQESKTNYLSVLFSLSLFIMSMLVVSCNWDSEFDEIAEFNNNKSAEISIDSGEIFTIVENQAEPKGGIQKFYDYVGGQLANKYPKQAQRLGIEGVVYVQFVIETDGSLTNAIAVKGIGGGCDEVAIETVGNSPSWTAGKHNGQIVRSVRVIPIRFKL
jgi:TonB family protein